MFGATGADNYVFWIAKKKSVEFEQEKFFFPQISSDRLKQRGENMRKRQKWEKSFWDK